jgi:hypothetical protein
MLGFGSRCLMCAIAMMLACTSATKARSWRYYGYHWHWYGHTWSNPNRGNDERRGDESRAEDKSDLRNRVGDFGSAIERMIRACDQQVVELKKMPLDSVTQIVKPAEDQRQALEQIQSAALSGAETLATNCPKKLPEGLTERLAILSHTLEAMTASLGVLRPTFTTFYGLLNDEQKARLVAMAISNNASGKQDVATKQNGSKQDSLCQQWVLNLRSWPVRQIEDGTSLSDEQHAALYELTAAIYRAVGRLGTACNADDRFTPPGRLEARQDALEALQKGIDAIRPAFSQFENELTDVQKAKLGRVVNVSTEITAVAH